MKKLFWLLLLIPVIVWQWWIFTRPEPVEIGGKPATAQYRALPDPRLTPGKLNPAVKQSNIHETVCRCYLPEGKCNSYAKEVRPPTSWTKPREIQSIKEYGLNLTPHEVEYDHFFPISIGGHPKHTDNLWAQPITKAKQKDRVEYHAWQILCKGNISLKEAQDMMYRWPEEYDKLKKVFGAVGEAIDPDDIE